MVNVAMPEGIESAGYCEMELLVVLAPRAEDQVK